MSDDSFFREVNEEMRQDQARALWDRYGPYALALAVLVVLATAGFVAWEYWSTSRANRSGDAFSQALTLALIGEGERLREGVAGAVGAACRPVFPGDEAGGGEHHEHGKRQRIRPVAVP